LELEAGARKGVLKKVETGPTSNSGVGQSLTGKGSKFRSSELEVRSSEKSAEKR